MAEIRTIHCSRKGALREERTVVKPTSASLDEGLFSPPKTISRKSSLEELYQKTLVQTPKRSPLIGAPLTPTIKTVSLKTEKGEIPEIYATDMAELILHSYGPSFGTVDSYLQDIFLLIFRRHMSKKQLLSISIKTYNSKNRGSVFSMGKQLRVTATLKKWISTYYWLDFSPDKKLMTRLTNFIETQETELDTLKDELKTILHNFREKPIKLPKLWYLRSPKKSTSRLIERNLKHFLNYQSKLSIFALNWIRLEAEWFCEIIPSDWPEFCKPKIKTSGYLESFVNFFNHGSSWVATTVLTSPEHLRNSIFIQFINIAQICLKYKSFHTLFEIMAGLNMTCVQRVMQLSDLPPNIQESFRELDNIISPQKNYSQYRKHLRACEGLALPFIGIFTKEIALIEETMDDYILIENQKYLNMKKFIAYGDLICGEILKIQEKAIMYKHIIPEVDRKMRSFLKRTLSLDEDELWRLSQKNQPFTSDSGSKKNT